MKYNSKWALRGQCVQLFLFSKKNWSFLNQRTFTDKYKCALCPLGDKYKPESKLLFWIPVLNSGFKNKTIFNNSPESCLWAD